MNIQETIEVWQDKATDAIIAQQLQDLIASDDHKAIEDAFYRELEFGTGGLRGIIGPGSNRMNIYTVGKATQGLANYLNASPATDGKPKSVAIAHDSRINSDLFTRVAAGVLAANGIKAYVYPRLEPTPALSWATRMLKCDAGICVTASHNPSAYNGYKVYGSDGCQITSQMAADIQAAIDGVDIFVDVKTMDFDSALSSGMAVYTDESVLDAFVDAVYAQSLEPEGAGTDSPLRVVYTPLNGTGLECVTRILKRIGVDDVYVVPEQEKPDGNFPTCPFPNPEIKEALAKGIELCEQVHPDLLLATDPDADRVGIAVENDGDYVLLTGNEVGVLLLDYVCRMRTEQGTMPQGAIAVSTIVSTDMCDAVVAKYGVELARTLTGFKYIGELIGKLESKGEQNRFIFGYEESYGYLSGPHVRDKDAVNASMLICQMARYYKKLGKNLVQAMADLYSEYGCYQNGLLNAVFEGADGARKMQDIMSSLRDNPPTQIAGLQVVSIKDYGPGVDGLPPSNVLQFDLEGAQKVLVRPSGTEPKIKAYLFAHGEKMDATKQLCSRLKDAMAELLQG